LRSRTTLTVSECGARNVSTSSQNARDAGVSARTRYRCAPAGARARPRAPGLPRLAQVGLVHRAQERAGRGTGLTAQVEAGRRVRRHDGARLVDENVAVLAAFEHPREPGAVLEQLAEAPQTKDRAYPGAELESVDGLREEIVGAGFQPFQASLSVVEGRDHHDGHLGESLVGPQLAEHGGAVHAGHHVVEQDEIGRTLAREVQRRRAVAREGELTVLVFENRFHGVAAERVVVDHEDEASIRHAGCRV
jgi:hypothetical protein